MKLQHHVLANGEFQGLQSYGNGLIDNLTYTYSGNQLTKVEDATGNTAGFSNGASTANECTYDNNGILTKDSNKNISTIAYNVCLLTLFFIIWNSLRKIHKKY